MAVSTSQWALVVFALLQVAICKLHLLRSFLMVIVEKFGRFGGLDWEGLALIIKSLVV